jgi:hypothetical protein
MHSHSTFLHKSLISFAYTARVSVPLFTPSSAKSITNPNVDLRSLSLSLSKKNHQSALPNIQQPHRFPPNNRKYLPYQHARAPSKRTHHPTPFTNPFPRPPTRTPLTRFSWNRARQLPSNVPQRPLRIQQTTTPPPIPAPITITTKKPPMATTITTMQIRVCRKRCINSRVMYRAQRETEMGVGKGGIIIRRPRRLRVYSSNQHRLIVRFVGLWR